MMGKAAKIGPILLCKLLDEQDVAELGLVIRCCPGVRPAPEVEVIYVKAWFGMLIR